MMDEMDCIIRIDDGPSCVLYGRHPRRCPLVRTSRADGAHQGQQHGDTGDGVAMVVD